MSIPTSLRAYEDCRELFDRAASDPTGARACLGTQEAAIQMRGRLHAFRKLDRKKNEVIYPPGHDMHGETVYDEYMVQLRVDTDNEWWVYITKRTSQMLAIEGLSETGEDPNAPA